MATAAGRASWLTLSALGALVLTQPAACTTAGSGTDTAITAAITELLRAVGPEVVLPALEDFGLEVDALEGDLELLAQAPEDASALSSARDRYAAAFVTWQRLELLQIGPAGAGLDTIGGQDLRDEIYSWPTVNACRVDQETLEAAWGEPDWFKENLVPSYGLDALEQLLYGPEETVCPSQVGIEEDWDALGEAEIASRRAAYAQALAADIAALSSTLVELWSPNGGDFSGALALETDDSPYESEIEALNAVFDALFYLEVGDKEAKLAPPLGLGECDEASCLDTLEAPLSELSTQAIAANLQGFRVLFTGGDGYGLGDLLDELGHGDLADQLLADTDAAIAVAQGISGPLDQAVESEPEQVQALYDAIDAVTDALKGDLATVLSLQVPQEASGDND